jgi:outer membrane receptor protein involved in Fe transport
MKQYNIKTVALALGFVTSSLLAQEVPSLESLLEMSVEDLVNIEVSSGTRVKVSARRSPTISTVVTSQEIRAMGARTLEDVLNLVPGVTVGRGQQINASESDLSIRGSKSFFGEDVLILWNGVRLNDPLSGGALAFSPDFPVASIERVEVIRGPGSAIYGANAFVSVISVITKQYEKDEVQGSARFGSGDGVYSNLKAATEIADDFNLLLSTDYYNSQSSNLLLPDFVQTVPGLLGPQQVPYIDNFYRERRQLGSVDATLEYNGLSVHAGYRRYDHRTAWAAGLPTSGVYVDALGIVHEDVDGKSQDSPGKSDNIIIDARYVGELSESLTSTTLVSYTDYAITSAFRTIPFRNVVLVPGVDEVVEKGFNGLDSWTHTVNVDSYLTQQFDNSSIVFGVNYQGDKSRGVNRLGYGQSSPGLPYNDIVPDPVESVPTNDVTRYLWTVSLGYRRHL